MNRKGFTLIELLAVLVLLGIITAITVVSVGGIFGSAKNKTEDVFVGTIKDALDVYIDSDAKELSFTSVNNCTINKSHGTVNLYKATEIKNFNSVINSKYKPITASDMKNPANEGVDCNLNAEISIYRDDDYIYYYSVSRSSLGCLKNESGDITNLPISSLSGGCNL